MNHDEIDKKYLFKENRLLRLELKQANELKQLHKEALIKLSQPHINGHDVISILLDLLSRSNEDAKVERLNEEILQLESKLMVLQKIVEETDNNEKQTYNLLADDFNKIQKENQRLEGQLHKFYEKIGEVDYLSGLVTKYKEIIIPSEQAIAFKKEQAQLLDVLLVQKQTIKKLTEEKQKLLKINVHMKDEVEKQKDEVRNMTMILNNPDLLNGSVMNNADNETDNILDELDHEQMEAKQEQSSNLSYNVGSSSMMNTTTNRGLNTTINFLKMQRKIIREQDDEYVGESNSDVSSDDADCAELNVLFPDKVEKIKTDRKTSKVPYLNMVKVREIMAKRENKMRKEIEADNRHINPTDKIIKLETELEITRKELTNQSLKFRTMEDELKQALRVNEELMCRNELIQEANEKLRVQYQNTFKDYQLTKIIAMRFQRAICEKKQESIHLMNDLHTSKDLNQNIRTAENVLRTVFKGRSHISRCQSEETL